MSVEWEGRIVQVVTLDDDGPYKGWEVVRHPGAVAVVAHDDEFLYLTKQYRPAVGRKVIELPAGLMESIDGDDPIATAQRELQEEVGKGAASTNIMAHFFSSPGFTDEKIILVRAWDLFDSKLQEDDDEDIEVVQWPLDNLKALTDMAMTAKTIVGAALLNNILNPTAWD
jgi:ADP-ribose pyrophosphatase